MVKDRCRDKSINQLLKGLLLGSLPFSVSDTAGFPTILGPMKQAKEQLHYYREVKDKLVIKVIKS